MTVLSHSDLAMGLADPVFGSQAVFRTVLTALSEPGKILTLPDQLSVALKIYRRQRRRCCSPLSIMKRLSGFRVHSKQSGHGLSFIRVQRSPIRQWMLALPSLLRDNPIWHFPPLISEMNDIPIHPQL